MQHTSGNGIPMIDYIVYHVVHMMDTAGIKPVEYLHTLVVNMSLKQLYIL